MLITATHKNAEYPTRALSMSEPVRVFLHLVGLTPVFAALGRLLQVVMALHFLDGSVVSTSLQDAQNYLLNSSRES